MIRFAFTKPDVKRGTFGKAFYVSHPSNGAIIAACDTQHEAEACAALIAALVSFVNENQSTAAGILDASRVDTPPETPESKKG